MHMRVLTVAAAIVMGGIPAVATAQTSSADPIRLGILGGVNSATVGGKDAEDADRLTAFLFGVSVLKPFGSGWGIRPELLYSRKGAEAPIDDPDFTGKAKIKIDYLDVPILVQYEGKTSGGVRPHVYAGPSVGFKVRCKLEGTGAGVTASMDCDDADLDIKSVDFAGVVGGGVALPIGNHFATLGVRYQHGFTDLESESVVKHRVLSVYAGFEFSLTR